MPAGSSQRSTHLTGGRTAGLELPGASASSPSANLLFRFPPPTPAGAPGAGCYPARELAVTPQVRLNSLQSGREMLLWYSKHTLKAKIKIQSNTRQQHSLSPLVRRWITRTPQTACWCVTKPNITLPCDPAATLLGVFPKELKRVHTESARGGDSSLIRHCQNLERPRRLDGWDSRGPPRQWRIRHPQRDSCPATNSCGGLGCARLSEGAHRRGLHTACFRPRGVPGKGQLWTVKGQRLSGPWAREGGTGGAQGTVGPRNHCAVLPRWARDTTHLSKPTDPAPPGLSLTCTMDSG